MKKQNLLKMTLVGLFLAIVGMSASYAQDQTVSVGSSYTYGPTNNTSDNFTFTVYQSDGTTPATAAMYTGAVNSTNSDNYDITWLKAGTYFVSMTETNNDCSTTQTFEVLVSGVEVIIVADNTSICSDGNTTFTVKLVNAGTTDPYTGPSVGSLSVTYTTSGVGTYSPASVATWDTSSDLTLTATITLSEGNSSSTTSVTITNVKTSSNADIPIQHATESTTVYDKPAANPIVVIP